MFLVAARRCGVEAVMIRAGPKSPVLTVLRQDAPKTNGDAHPSSR
jgi:hypothetical protein